MNKMISSLTWLDMNVTTVAALQQYNNITNNSTNDSYYGNSPVFPPYIRTTATVICSLIMGIGVLGNVMVPIVIFKSKDMRNSTNVFLMNLSFADLMVLLVCTPTVLVEVNSPPETWVLGEEMCKAVPFIEMMVTHASVLTILAISFERYYAICEPLKAGYICTKTRAFFICLCAWFLAGLLTSPIVCMTDYTYLEYVDGSNVSVCQTLADTFWSKTFFLGGTLVFFALPLAILVMLYSIIAINLMTHPGIIPIRRLENPTSAQRYRKKVVMMLGTVVTFFFVCLLPFRALIVWIVLAPHEEIMKLGNEGYYSLLYFCRIMFYLNSAINPILYNLMSSKFRNGFLKLCGIKKNCFRKHTRALLRTSTFNTSSLTAITTSSIHRTSVVDYAQRKKSLTEYSTRRGLNRRNSCSKSLLLCGASHRAKSYVTKVNCDRRKTDRDKCHNKLLQIHRRKSFSDFLSSRESSVPILKHSQSMDSIFRRKIGHVTRKSKSIMKKTSSTDLISLSKTSPSRNISGKEGNISDSMRNGRRSKPETDQIVKIVDQTLVKRKKARDVKESFV